MPPFVLYLLKLSISLSIVWIFYQLLLRRLTFYRLNRWYLLGYTLLSFFIPLINIGPMLDDGHSGEPLVVQFIPAIGHAGVVTLANELYPRAAEGWKLLGAVIALGALLLLIRLAARWLSLHRLRRDALLIEGTGINIYQVDASIVPFSFGNAIYINQQLHTEKEWSDIILHEYVHVRQKHTIDIVLAELVCVLNWYNPFAWLIRWSIRQNLEFIADQQVLANGVDRKGYQYHLLGVVGDRGYRLANNFNFSSLKKRIIMMNKIRSAKLHLVKFLFIVPLLAVLLVAFRDRYTGIWRPSSGKVQINAAGIVVDIVDQSPLAGVTVSDSASGWETITDTRGFYKLGIPVTGNSMRIRLTYKKTGYTSSSSETVLPLVKETRGLINIEALENPSNKLNGVYIGVPFMDKCPQDPAYADVLQALREEQKWNAGLSRYHDIKKEHPEVSLFYTTEDGQKHLAILNDGTAEKYGYPGSPDLKAMEDKYGPLPAFMTEQKHSVNAGYLSRWEAIAAQAEKSFRTDNPEVRTVVFPGDSRVLVVTKSGETRMYDMDNAASKERTAFESLYGRLPACVPQPGFNSDERTGVVVTNGQTVIRPVPVAVAHGAGAARDTISKDTLKGKPWYVVDGIQRPDFEKDSLRPEDISSIEVVTGDEALRYMGEKGAHGVVFITTQKFRQQHPPMKEISTTSIGQAQPLYIVDGVEMATLDNLKPDGIASIDILKGDDAVTKFGDKARNGVVLIHMLKHGSHPQAVVEMDTKNGKIIGQADTIKIASDSKMTIYATPPKN